MRPNYPWQRGLQFFNGVLFLPNSVDGTGRGLGSAWNAGTGTVTHATPAAAFDTQWKRTIYTNAGVANEDLGPRLSNAGDYQFWVGNAANCGGFYFSSLFRIDAWDNNNGRIFVGLSASATSVAAAAAVPNNSIGLSHIATDGADVLKLRVVDNGGTATTKDITTNALNPGILAAGTVFLWEMWAFPNSQGAINTNVRLSYADTAAAANRMKKVKWESSGGLTTNQFMAPQCQMSPGADTTVGHFAISVANVYCAPWSGEMD